jgi:hypothetical protein
VEAFFNSVTLIFTRCPVVGSVCPNVPFSATNFNAISSVAKGGDRLTKMAHFRQRVFTISARLALFAYNKIHYLLCLAAQGISDPVLVSFLFIYVLTSFISNREVKDK